MPVPDLQDALDCLQRKEVDDAIATLERKLDELPAHLTAHVLLARAYETKQQWKQALTCWENVYFLMPNSPVAREGKRRVLRRLNRGDEAEDIEEVAPSAPARVEPASDAVEPSGDEKDPDEAAPEQTKTDDPTTATEAVSELETLRQQAEEEARRGGARAELSDSSDTADEAPAPKTPEDRVEQMGDGDDDLDRLIDELESARIEPSPDVEDVPAPDLDNNVDDLVSETLARIHKAQGQYRKAAQIYVKLASQEPDQARDYLEKAAGMRREAEQNASDEDA